MTADPASLWAGAGVVSGGGMTFSGPPGVRAVRRGREVVPEEVVDRAAGLFARQGLANTSLDQVAYAVSFSKTGLLPHFPTKDSLIAAAMVILDQHAAQVHRLAADLPLGRDRDLVVVTSCVDFVLRRPGVSALNQSLAMCDVATEAMHHQAELVLAALGVDLEHGDPDRLVDVSSALSGLQTVAQRVAGVVNADRWRELVIATAMRTLGHDADERPAVLGA